MGRLCVAAVLMARGNERARYGRLRLGCSLAIHVGEHRDDDQQHHDHVVATDQRRHGTSDTPTEHRAELRDVSAVAHSLDAREERDDVAHNQSDDSATLAPIRTLRKKMGLSVKEKPSRSIEPLTAPKDTESEIEGSFIAAVPNARPAATSAISTMQMAATTTVAMPRPRIAFA